jgi:glucokinase
MKNKVYLGLDVGGTKIAAGLVTETGKIIWREKIPTPKKSSPDGIISAIIDIIETAVNDHSDTAISAIGIGIPGIVNNNKIIATPNINMAGRDIASLVYKKFKIKTYLGNDVNLGVLGEKWIGAAKNAQNVVGLFLGTGLGGGIIIGGKLLLGQNGAAAELGHMAIAIDGPQCTCSNKGCLEAFVGRWAIERDIWNAVKRGKKTLITKITGKSKGPIKSKVLAKALKKKDRLTVKVMENVCAALGNGCVSLIHIFDPEMIVLGGGVMEACGDFILKRVQKIISRDKFFKKLKPVRVTASRLKDDAVIIGAAALAKHSV